MFPGLKCEIGLRTRTYHVLTGSVLSVWNKVEMVIASTPGASHNKMQVIRLRTEDGQRIVGECDLLFYTGTFAILINGPP